MMPLGEERIHSSRRIRIGWYLFDFANSILIINGGLYFPQWIVIDNSVPDVWFNVSIVISSIVLIATAPILGFKANGSPNRIYTIMRTASLMMFIAGIVTGLSIMFLEPGMGRGIVGLVSLIIIMYCYQLSLVFYNSFMRSISSKRDRVRISGYGMAAGWLGGIIGILVILPFVEGYVPMISADRGNAFIPATLIFGLLTVFSFHLMKTLKSQPVNNSVYPKYKASLGATFTDSYRRAKGTAIGVFLLSYLLISDAILTLQNNSPIYLEQVLQFTDTEKAALFLILLTFAAIGGVFTDFIVRRAGLKRTMLVILVCWFIILATIPVINDKTIAYAMFSIIGILFGLVFSLSRAIFALLIPKDRDAQFFGIYTSFERSASILGPIFWSIPVTLCISYGPFRYRAAIAVLSIFALISVLVFKNIKLDNTVHVFKSENQ